MKPATEPRGIFLEAIQLDPALVRAYLAHAGWSYLWPPSRGPFWRLALGGEVHIIDDDPPPDPPIFAELGSLGTHLATVALIEGRSLEAVVLDVRRLELISVQDTIEQSLKALDNLHRRAEQLEDNHRAVLSRLPRGNSRLARALLTGITVGGLVLARQVPRWTLPEKERAAQMVMMLMLTGAWYTYLRPWCQRYVTGSFAALHAEENGLRGLKMPAVDLGPPPQGAYRK